jgi:pimeloyl-ACP methyl ester carboxylesterase
MASALQQKDSGLTRHRIATVNGRKVFYREAGNPASPTIVLLHGLPTSSQMFRNLIPALADRFHLIAPDYIGFGHSEAPSRDEFEYTFDHLAASVRGLLEQLGLRSYILYMQDYGGPVGFRLFAEKPEQVKGFIIQNANAYLEGVGELPKSALLPLWENRNAETEKPAREFLNAASTRFHWTVGARDVENINPDNWILDQAFLDRPGTQAYQVDLLENYKTNVASYESWQAAFRIYRPKTLIVWGDKDPFFVQPGARAYLRDLPEAKLVWLDAGTLFSTRICIRSRKRSGPCSQVRDLSGRNNGEADAAIHRRVLLPGRRRGILVLFAPRITRQKGASMRKHFFILG